MTVPKRAHPGISWGAVVIGMLIAGSGCVRFGFDEGRTGESGQKGVILDGARDTQGSPDASIDLGRLDSAVDTSELVLDTDARLDSAPPDTTIDSTPDTTIDSTPPDTTIDSTPPDATIDSTPPDTTLDSTPPDTTIDLPPPDTTLDLPPPDTTLDLPPPDTTLDLPPPDTTLDLPPPDTTLDLPIVDSVPLDTSALPIPLVHSWSSRFGSTASDNGNAVVIDSSGNITIVGSFGGTVDFGGGGLKAQSTDIFIASYTSTGVHRWSKDFGSTLLDRAYGVGVDSAGNITLTGDLANKVDFGGGQLSSAGNQDAFVASYDSNGVHRWSTSFGDAAFDLGNAVAVDGSGNVTIIGSFQGTVDCGGGALTSNAGSNDIFIVSYDSSGAHRWSKAFGGAQWDSGQGVAVDGSANVIVTGTFQETVNFEGGPLTSAGSNDIFVARYNSSGVHSWSNAFGGTLSDNSEGLVVDASGNSTLIGYFKGSASFGGNLLTSVAGSDDIVVASYDANGAHRWSKAFGDTLNDKGHGLAVDVAGNITLTGVFQGMVDFGGVAMVSAGDNDIFIANYDSSGVHRWSKAYGSPLRDYGYGVAVDGNDIIVTGAFYDTIDFGGGALTSLGFDDVFLLRVYPQP